MTFTVWRWQFVQQQFAPAGTFSTESEAHAFVRREMEGGKDISRFRVHRGTAPQPYADDLPFLYAAA